MPLSARSMAAISDDVTEMSAHMMTVKDGVKTAWPAGVGGLVAEGFQLIFPYVKEALADFIALGHWPTYAELMAEAFKLWQQAISGRPPGATPPPTPAPPVVPPTPAPPVIGPA